MGSYGNADFYVETVVRKHETKFTVHKLVYLSLGSNLGTREANLETAIERLGSLGEVAAVSSLRNRAGGIRSPALVSELRGRAQDGKDAAAIASQHSGHRKENGTQEGAGKRSPHH